MLSTVRIPKYRHHKASGQAFVQVKNRRHYLGKFGTEAAEERYRRFVAELLASPAAAKANAASAPRLLGQRLAVVELLAAYWRFADSYYRKDDKLTGWTTHIRLMVRLLKESYATLPVTDFGPLALKALRQKLIDAGHSRGYINKLIAIVPAVFKWGWVKSLSPSPLIKSWLPAGRGSHHASLRHRPQR